MKKDRSSEMARILVVDDAPDTVEVLQRNLSEKGYRVLTAPGAEAAARILESTEVDLVITDLKMPGISGLDLVRYVRENYKEIEIIMITGYPTLKGAVEAVKRGVEEYLAKPFTEEELFTAVQRALEKLSIRKSANNKSVDEKPRFPGLIGESDPMQAVFQSIVKAASTSATLLITGESGTGKDAFTL
ncbi:MAG: response regulator [Spirochaetota bacterium]